ncbi:Hypothetical protein BN2458_PEG0778 [Helicobacter typhlonius]|uniref:Uncharacterized protein n=1 Tax=Helicobacter typhlonius TaxID=76936 RepID=A0A0S4PWE4_9HELI|nr:Hypothetical protein BN2458_PEG0778 [Helicobacter typhlonius]
MVDSYLQNLPLKFSQKGAKNGKDEEMCIIGIVCDNVRLWRF